MNRRAVLLLALSLLGVSPAPTPLVVGTVRDQHGLPIAGALVQISGKTGVTSSTTAADGTFAVEASGTRATISCAFCATLDVPVDEDGAVVAIVTRYDAIASTAPSRSDVRHVPNADAPSILSLAPFVVLNQSSQLLPGPRVIDRGVNAAGGLAIFNGMPSYDIVTDTSPFYTLPYRYAGALAISPIQNVDVYDGNTNGGTFFVDSVDSGAVYAGTVRGAQGALAGSSAFAAAAFSDDDEARAARGFAETHATVRDTFVSTSVASANGLAYSPSSALDSWLSSARLSISRNRSVEMGVNAWIDRAGYDVDQSAREVVHAQWSDAAAQAYVKSHAALAPFAQITAVHDTGLWGGASWFSASVDETSASAGIAQSAKLFDFIAEGGVSSARFADRDRTTYSLRDSLLSFTFHPDYRWSIETSLSTGYRLPTLLLEYASPLLPDDAYTDRDRTLETTAWYTDRSRMRAGVTALSRRTAGLDEGTTSSFGASFAWQITPELSLRAWSLHVAPNVVARPAARFDSQPANATPASAWLTYEHRGTRLDAIWRRDLIDWKPSTRFDVEISAPLAERLEWFVATNHRLRRSGVEAGVRF